MADNDGGFFWAYGDSEIDALKTHDLVKRPPPNRIITGDVINPTYRPGRPEPIPNSPYSNPTWDAYWSRWGSGPHNPVLEEGPFAIPKASPGWIKASAQAAPDNYIEPPPARASNGKPWEPPVPINRDGHAWEPPDPPIATRAADWSPPDRPVTEAAPKDQGVIGRLWDDLSHFAGGVAAGVEGEGLPKGRGSEFPTGRAGFAGQAIGAGTRGIAEGLWEAIKTPGQVLSGERPMRPGQDERQAVDAALPLGLMAAGQGFRPPAITAASPGAMAAAPIGRAFQQQGGLPGLMRDVRGGVERPGLYGGSATPEQSLMAGGARVEPLPQMQTPPNIQAPPLRATGPALPEAQPGTPRPAGGIATPTSPSPLPDIRVPPLRAGGPALPEAQPGIPRPPGAMVGPGPALPPRIVAPPLRATGPALPEQRPGVPRPPGGIVSDAIPASRAAEAIVGNDMVALDRALTRDYRRAVKPGPLGIPSLGRLNAQDRQIVTAVDRIIANRPALRVTDAAGNSIPFPTAPSLRQFAEGLDETKKIIFDQYDQMARQAGGAGVRVDLSPAIAKLREIAETPQVRDLHPTVADDALRLAETMAQRGSYSPAEAQDVIQNLNKTLSGFWRNPTHETVSRASLLAPITTILRNGLDQAVTSAAGPGYQALRTQYQALRSVEKDLASALQKQANKLPGGLAGSLADLASAEQFLHGIITINPGALARAGTIKAAKAILGRVNDPNRAIGRMFARRMAPQQIPFRPGAAALGAYGAGVVEQRQPRGAALYMVDPPPGTH